MDKESSNFIFLANEFKTLAEDKSWPWKSSLYETRFASIQEGTVIGILDAPQQQQKFILESPLHRAKLALMVVEMWIGTDIDQAIRHGWLNDHLKGMNINPDHFTEVKRRVDESSCIYR